ncbi:MAG: HEAT repeat domain-containing protein [Thermodesulfobacteriota bacterium]|nr:HEAT repeat domain-containing protein [Thermodesulfobacteriota bacterium]
MKIVYPRDAWRLLYPVRVLLVGLLASEVVAAWIVWSSNHELYRKLSAIGSSGYGPLPGTNVDPSLLSLEAAWAGGLFFTLSIGAGVALLTFGAVMLVRSLPLDSQKPVKWIMLLVWGVVLVWGNAGGICPGLSAFLVLIPPVVIVAAIKGVAQRSGAHPLAWRRTLHAGLIGLLLLLWLPRINGDVFVNIKDNLLLTSRPGLKTVDLYYRYTLYPAEVFKSLFQKQITAHALVGGGAASIASQVNRALMNMNSFPVPDSAYADFLVQKKGDVNLVLMKGDKTVQAVTAGELTSNPGQVMLQYSAKTDDAANFRKVTILSLLGVAPLVLYLGTFLLFCMVPGIFMPLRISTIVVPVLCCIVWSAAIVCLDTPSSAGLDRQKAAAALTDGSRKEKIAALRYIHHHKLEITRFPGYQQLLNSPDFAQRYWMVKCLGNTHHPLAMQWIIHLMQSESPYIVCKAIEAGAGHKSPANSRRFTRALVDILESSENWYVQYYAYRVAREYGWIPVKSG